jgi:hypothetical protein
VFHIFNDLKAIRAAVVSSSIDGINLPALCNVLWKTFFPLSSKWIIRCLRQKETRENLIKAALCLHATHCTTVNN